MRKPTYVVVLPLVAGLAVVCVIFGVQHFRTVCEQGERSTRNAALSASDVGRTSTSPRQAPQAPASEEEISQTPGHGNENWSLALFAGDAPRDTADRFHTAELLAREGVADLPDSAELWQGIRKAIYRNPLLGLYSERKSERAEAGRLIVQALLYSYYEDVWLESIKALERWPDLERRVLFRDLMRTGLPQAIELQIRDLSHPDARRRLLALDAASGMLGSTKGAADASYYENWLAKNNRHRGSNGDPATLLLEYVDRIQPIAELRASTEENPNYRRQAEVLTERCRTVRELLARGERPDWLVWSDPQEAAPQPPMPDHR